MVLVEVVVEQRPVVRDAHVPARPPQHYHPLLLLRTGNRTEQNQTHDTDADSTRANELHELS